MDKTAPRSPESPTYNWPVEWLRRIVEELRQAKQMPRPAVFMNGNPPQHLVARTGLSGWLALKSPEETVRAPDYRWIDIHSLFPIYASEADLVRQSGAEELLQRFQQESIPLHIDPERPNVV